MKPMDDLKEMLMSELERIAKKGDISHTDLDTIHKLTDTIKNIDKIEMYDGNEYSHDGNWTANGSYGRYSRADRRYSYDDEDMSRNDMSRNDSYSNRGMHYVRGHYSRAEEGMTDKIEEMLNDSRLTVSDKSTLKRAMEILRK